MNVPLRAAAMKVKQARIDDCAVELVLIQTTMYG